MNGKLYIKKFIRDDGETLSFDAEEIYLSENNTLLVRSDPDTTAVEFTEEDGGEMIRQRGATYSQPVSGLIVPKSTEYWSLCVRLSRFFILNHTYKIVYIKRDGSMFSMNRAWINAGLQIVPVPYENYSTWTIEFRIGDNSWTEYVEDSQGKEIYSNSVELPLLTAGTGGEVWSDATQQTLSGVGNYFTIDGTSISANINKLEVRGDTHQQTYSGKNLLRNNNGDTQTISGVTFTKNPDGTITANGTATAGINYYINGSSTRWAIPEGTYTLSTGGSNGTSSTYFVFIDGSNDVYWNSATPRLTQTVPSGGLDILPRIVVRQGQTLNNVVFKPMLEQGSTATSFEPYVGGIPAPNPDYPQNVRVVTGEQTIEVSDGNNQDQSYTVDLGSIELCKIGDYQDYIYKSGDDWYIHKAVGKIVAEGSAGDYNGTNNWYWIGLSSYSGANTVSSGPLFSDRFTFYKRSDFLDTSLMGCSIDSATTLLIRNTDCTSTSDYRTWLASNNATFYYPLDTPINTKITDATLRGQLEALAEAQAYSGRTVYQTNSTTVPAILSVELLQSVSGGEIWDNVGAVWEEGVGGVQTINVETTQTTYPVWTVTGPCSNPTLQNDTTDTIASFDGMIASGQTLTVDFADNTAYLDSAPVAKYVSGYVSLAPGENVIGFNSDGGSTQTSTISWDNIIN